MATVTAKSVASAHWSPRELLREVCSESEYQRALRRGFVELASTAYSDRLYRVPLDGDHVDVLDQGARAMTLVLPHGHPAVCRNIAALLVVLLQANETAFLATAASVDAVEAMDTQPVVDTQTTADAPPAPEPPAGRISPRARWRIERDERW